MDGYIFLHRKLLKNPWMNKAAYRAVWIEILLNATFSGEVTVLFSGERINLKPGQFTTGAYRLAKATGVPRGTVQRILETFKNEHMIEQRTDRQCSLITVLKWSQYQKFEQRNEQRVSNEWVTDEQRVSTKEEGKKEKKEQKRKENYIATPDDVAGNGVNQVISLFQSHLNQNISYGNRTQRKAAADLLKKHGIEKLEKLILFCEKIRGDEFAPVITTPWQLWEREAQIAAYWVRLQKSENKLAIIS